MTQKIKFSVADPDPGSGAFLTPGSGMGRKSASGSGIWDEQPGSYFLELRNYFFWVKIYKILKFLMRIRDPGWRQFGSGIRDRKYDPRDVYLRPRIPDWDLFSSIIPDPGVKKSTRFLIRNTDLFAFYCAARRENYVTVW